MIMLPLSLLVDSRIEQIKVWDDRTADGEQLLTAKVLTARITMLGFLLFCDQTSPTQMLFEGVFVVALSVGIAAKFNG
jgi:hypothetical protein